MATVLKFFKTKLGVSLAVSLVLSGLAAVAKYTDAADPIVRGACGKYLGAGGEGGSP
jgi:hypothetical protein